MSSQTETETGFRYRFRSTETTGQKMTDEVNTDENTETEKVKICRRKNLYMQNVSGKKKDKKMRKLECRDKKKCNFNIATKRVEGIFFITTFYFIFLCSFDKQTIPTNYDSNKANWHLKGNKIVFLLSLWRKENLDISDIFLCTTSNAFAT